jgi:RNA polymerase sigma factor (sigma-70 family)
LASPAHDYSSSLHFDANGVALNPLVLALCAQTATSYKFAPLAPRAPLEFTINPRVAEYPPYPPYCGEYKSRMREWSQIRTRNHVTNAAKFHARELNQTHAAFLANEIDLEQYALEVSAYLEHGHEPTDVLKFILTIQDKLESGSFCPEESTTKFSTKLLKAWEAYRRNNGVTVTPLEQKERPAPVVVANKDAVISAHAGFVAGTVNQYDFLTTTRKFTLRRVKWQFKGTDQHGQTEEDITQAAVAKMWDALPTVKGTSGDFFAWYRTLIDNTVKDAKRGSLKESKRHAPFYVETEDDEGNSEEVENPGIHGRIQFKRNGKVTYQEAQAQFQRELPEFIQGKDLKICQYIREDHDYEKIGGVLGITENAVTKRIQKIFNHIQEMKAAGLTV